MKREILQKIDDLLFPIAQAIIEQDHAQHQRLLLTYRVKGEEIEPRALIQLPQSDKDAAGMIIKIAAKACPVDGVCVLADEAWIKFVSEGEEVDTSVPVKKQPGRREVVTFFFFGADWGAFVHHEIKRNPDKLLRGLIRTDARLEGRLAPHG